MNNDIKILSLIIGAAALIMMLFGKCSIDDQKQKLEEQAKCYELTKNEKCFYQPQED